MAITKDTRVFAASFGYSQCDAMSTYVSLFPGKAIAAADDAREAERLQSRDTCDKEGEDCDEGSCDFCWPSLWQNGEQAYSLGDLLDSQGISEHRDALIAGDVIAVGGC